MRQRSAKGIADTKTMALIAGGFLLVCTAIIFSWYSQHQMHQVIEPRLMEISELRFILINTYLVSEKIAAGDTTASDEHMERLISRADSVRHQALPAHLPKSITRIPAFTHDLAAAYENFDSLKALIAVRHAATTGVIDHTYDRPIDSLFLSFTDHLLATEKKLQKAIIQRFTWFLAIQFFLLFSCVGIAAAVGYLYYHFARRHKSNLDALAVTHRKLDAAFAEKVSSEQQLKAANQQLRANEQQLKATNQQLRANEQVLRIYKKSVEHAEDLISAVNTRYQFVFINSAFSRYYGVTPESVAGKTLPEVMGDEVFSATTKRFIDRAFRGERIQYEITHLFAQHGHRAMQVSYYPLVGDEGAEPVVIQVLRDVSERKKAEEERQKVQRLETVGQLAAGIAHDFNNILGGIFGFISLAKMSVDAQSEPAQYLENALSAYGRAKDLTQQLLTFSRGGLPVKKRMPLEPIIREATNLSLSGSAVRAILRLGDALPAVEIDGGQIYQVLSNLIINARQAMPDGGEVTVTAQQVDVAEGALPALAAGRYVRIAVSDTGIGIAPEHLQCVFEPFFSTKQEGSGLGLSVCFSIVKKHGGHISVESVLGKGSTFTFYLPAAEGAPSPAAEGRPAAAGGTGAVLVMDDDEHICFVTEHLLSRAGYAVTVTKNGTEAVACYQRALGGADAYRAVVLDLTVPGGMGGLETFIRLKELDPNVQGVVTSGYSNDPVLANYASYGFAAAIKKPYYPDELLEAVAKAASRGAA